MKAVGRVGLTVLLLVLWPVAAVPQALPPGERGLKSPARAAAQRSEDPQRARVIVKFKRDGTLARERSAQAGPAAAAAPQHAARMAQRLGLGADAQLRDGRVVMPHVQVLHGTGLSSRALIEKLLRDPEVEYAEVDQRATILAAPNDPLYPSGQSGTMPAAGQWYLRPPDSTLVSAIDAETAWDTTMGSASVTVAVLDTGVLLDHPDLAGKLRPGYDFIAADPGGGFATAGDGDGIDPDPSDPGDWVTAGQCGPNDPPNAETSSWHGTQVAGLIGAATGNGVGMAGAAPSVMLLPVRVLGHCGGYQSDIVAAMRWAAGLSNSPVVNGYPAKVVNLSLGSSGSCSITYQAAVTELVNADVSVVVAAGNDTGLAANQPSNCVGAIGVAGLRHAGTKVGYSNVGPLVAIAAPAGNCVLTGINDPCLYPLVTTINSGSNGPLANIYSDAFNFSLGTSFSAPLVAATAALMLSANPNLSPAQIKQGLWNSARAFPTSGAQTGGALACHEPNASEQIECYCTTTTCGGGMLDARAAVLRAAAPAPIPTASMSFAPGAPSAGMSVSLSVAAAVPVAGRSIMSYQWQITSGSAIARISSATNASQATVATMAAGSFSVRLTVTDSAGETATDDRLITVTAAPVATSPPASGGGALGWPWLLGLLAALISLYRLPLRKE